MSSIHETVASHADSFIPRRFLRNGHLQTIVGNYLPRANALPRPEAEMVEVAPAAHGRIASRVLCHCHWQPQEVRARRPTAIIVHGLEGSSSSQYVVGNSNKLWQAGCNIVRMNMRNCNGTEAETPTLYHSGYSGDVLAVMQFFIRRHALQSISLIGYSMGGNLVLKLAGDLGASAPKELHSAIGISPAVDLGASADELHRPVNRLYEMKFLRALLRRYRYKASLFPDLYDASRAANVRSLREFDDRVTAFYSDFANADDYYHRAAAARVLDRIAVPTLILHAHDDPFVRITEQTRSAILTNPHITFIDVPHGGHCAFLTEANENSGYDGYWAEHTLLRFLLSNS